MERAHPHHERSSKVLLKNFSGGVRLFFCSLSPKLAVWLSIPGALVSIRGGSQTLTGPYQHSQSVSLRMPRCKNFLVVPSPSLKRPCWYALSSPSTPFPPATRFFWHFLRMDLRKTSTKPLLLMQLIEGLLGPLAPSGPCNTLDVNPMSNGNGAMLSCPKGPRHERLTFSGHDYPWIKGNQKLESGQFAVCRLR